MRDPTFAVFQRAGIRDKRRQPVTELLRHQANAPFGIVGLAGNVAEWVTAEPGSRRVLGTMGGSFKYPTRTTSTTRASIASRVSALRRRDPRRLAGGGEVMEAGRSGRGGVVGPLMAVALIGAIGWLTAGVLPRIRVEGRLQRAATLIGEDPVRGFEFLDQETWAEGLSARQRERGAALARDAIARICSRRPMLRMVGGNVYDSVRPHPYVTASRGMMLVFELPPGIKALGWRIRVSEGSLELCEVLSMDDGRQARGEVPLPARGAVTVDVDLVCRVGVYGIVTFPIAHDLRLVHDPSGPSVILRAGATVLDLGDGQPRALQVERGTPLRVELSDELGLLEMQWSIDGVACDPFDWREAAEAQTRVVIASGVPHRARDARPDDRAQGFELDRHHDDGRRPVVRA